MAEHFTPPYPKPHKTKGSLLRQFIFGMKSWIHVLKDTSYRMKMGHYKLPKGDLFMVNEPSLVKKVLKTDAAIFPKHAIVHEVLKPLLGESIFTTNGEQWQRQRQMMDDAFTHTHLKRVFPLMQAAIGDMIVRLEKSAGSERDIDVEMTHVTADIIFRTILSQPLSAGDAKQIFEAFTVFQDCAQRVMLLKGYGLPSYFSRRKSLKAAAKIRPILAAIIKQRYDAFQSGDDTENRDILAALIRATDKNTGESFDYEELVDHVSMLFLAGHETSASALTWSLYLIGKCPHTQAALHKEVDEVIGNDSIAYEHVKKLSFTRDVFKEALRLYPPVGFFLRQAAEVSCMRDKEIHKGDMVVVAPWLMHRNQQEWQEADSFCPARFHEQQAPKAVRTSYIPFGTGPRVCVGQGFAMQEAILCLASIVQHFTIEASEGHVPKPIGRVTIRPENGVRLTLRKRA